jgi:hypothetical protein
VRLLLYASMSPLALFAITPLDGINFSVPASSFCLALIYFYRFCKAYDLINNPKLIKWSWERCVVGTWNLSWESFTSTAARQAMLALQKTDPAF